MPLVILAKLTAQEGKRAELLAALQALVDNAHHEPDTLVYAMHTDNADQVTVWFYERYLDDMALRAHSSSDVMKAVGAQLAPLTAGRAEIIKLTDVSHKGL
jgi:quinol monooxygenase YgiN